MLLAYAPREIVEACVEHLQPVTRYTITERGRMLRELATVRRHGYARTVEEMGYGTCSLAVPVLGAGDEVVAALGAGDEHGAPRPGQVRPGPARGCRVASPDGWRT